MKVKTEFWGESDIERWRHHYSQLAWLLGMCAVVNVIYSFFSKNFMMGIINGCFLALSFLIMLSYNRYEKEVYYELEENGKGRGNNTINKERGSKEKI